ncbi:hypothetical protein VaNZ11_009219 [Volvox africanus]|uniref:Major facilitator superfamily (MFS) profile domain-containing protein n=1 Tax=Volvox africanus TaxID=51714 RepID=A0ABQ5S8P7_9CHLO|nr:hypothetical protein VaNZ11_009219 [Volvox africanus]
MPDSEEKPHEQRRRQYLPLRRSLLTLSEMYVHRDIVVLFLARTVRQAAYGTVGVILALYLRAVGLTNDQLGILLTLTLLGDSVISLAVTRWADRIGRRLMLVSSCLLVILSGLVYGEVLQPSFGLLLVAATVGVLSPSGNEVGPFMALEQSILAELVSPGNRTHVFAWYNLVGYSMAAVGALAAGGALTWAQRRYGISELDGLRVVFLQYGISGGVLLGLFALLSEQVERPERRERCQVERKACVNIAVDAGTGSMAVVCDEEAGLQEPLLAAAAATEQEQQRGEEDVNDGWKWMMSLPSEAPPAGLAPEGVLTGIALEGDSGSGGDSTSPESAGMEPDGSSQAVHMTVSTRVVESFPLDDLTEYASEWHGSEFDVCDTPMHRAALSLPPLDNDSDGDGDGSDIGTSEAVHVHVGKSGDVDPNMNDGAVSGPPGLMGLSARSCSVVAQLSLLFAADSFAGGLVTGTLLSYFFQTKYGVSMAYLGSLLFGANMLAAVSSLLSGSVAARIGLINTMVFTHLPSNILMLLIPLMPSLSLATVMVFLRFSISQMDVAPRASYVAGVVRPDERTAAMGIVNISKSIGAAFGPLLTGWLAERGLFHWSFFLGGGIKIAYDLALLWRFAHVAPEH